LTEFTVKVDRSPEAIRGMENAVFKFLEEAGLHLENQAKRELENDPRRIDTGRLRNSITHTTDNKEPAVYVGTNVEYAPYVHEGTRRMSPNRFLKNAFERNADQLKRKLEETLRNA